MKEENPAAAALPGVWRLIGNERRMEDTGDIIVRPAPRGYALFDPGGRVMVLMTGSNRTPPTDHAEAAALFNGMTAYTGRYRVEGDQVVIAVDLAWHPGWEGTEQRRVLRLAGDRLTLTTGPQEHPLAPGRTFIGTFTWIREQ